MSLLVSWLSRTLPDYLTDVLGPGAYFPRRSNHVTTADGVPAGGTYLQSRKTGTSSQQYAAPAKQQQIQADEDIVNEEEENDDDVWPARMPTSARR